MSEREIAYLSFTERGKALAARLQRALGGETTCARDRADFSLSRWTRARFGTGRALVFVGAAGIAVRAVAPLLRSKATDPAVVALDEAGRFVIPLVSGHLGGANELARAIARVCGGTPVLTTATDVNGVFAVDLWARRQGLTVMQPEGIKPVSARLLAGGTIHLSSSWPVAGEPPAGVVLTDREADVTVDVRPGPGLCLVPPALTLGIGCRRGTAAETLERVLGRFCARRSVSPQAIRAAASIDRKRDEPGLLAFCRNHGWPVTFYAADALARVPGAFTASPFVEETVGVDNVCERSAALACGGGLLEQKYAEEGVTFALALGEVRLDWSW